MSFYTENEEQLAKCLFDELRCIFVEKMMRKTIPRRLVGAAFVSAGAN